MHVLQFGVRHITLDRGHAARLVVRMFQRIDQRPVVAAVAGGLHDHVFVKAQVVAQREQLVFRRVARRVFPLRRIGKLRARAEHMAVRIHRTGGQLEAGFAGPGVPVEPAGSLGEFHGFQSGLMLASRTSLA
jgi:hypothetical protein